MKKKRIKKETDENTSLVHGYLPEEESDQELNDATSSIEEFIKIRKLQNQILEKMLEQISYPDPKEIKQQKKNK